MKYYKHFETTNGTDRVKYFQPEGTNMCIPNVAENLDFSRMMEAVGEGSAEIVEVDDTPVPTWEDERRAGYGTWQDQLDKMFHGTWQDHVAAVKAAHPKP